MKEYRRNERLFNKEIDKTRWFKSKEKEKDISDIDEEESKSIEWEKSSKPAVLKESSKPIDLEESSKPTDLKDSSKPIDWGESSKPTDLNESSKPVDWKGSSRHSQNSASSINNQSKSWKLLVPKECNEKKLRQRDINGIDVSSHDRTQH